MKKTIRRFIAVSILLIGFFTLPVSAGQITPPENGMVLVACQSGDDVFIGVAFAVSGNENGATVFLSNYQIAAKKPEKVLILLDSLDADHAISATVTNSDATLGFAEITASKPIAQRSPVSLGRVETLSKGQTVFALGFPKVSANGSYTVKDVTASQGKVINSTYAVGKDLNVLLTSCTIDQTNSGGPLVTEDGVVVGISLGQSPQKDGSVALPMDYLLKNNGKATAAGTSGEESDAGSLFDYRLLAGVAVLGLGAAYLFRKNATGQKASSAFHASSNMVVNESTSAIAPIEVTRPIVSLSSSTSQIQQGSTPQITGTAGFFNGDSIPIRNKVIIGRDPNQCNLVFPPITEGVSSLHCELQNVSGHLELIDRGSTYGTFLGNGTKLEVNRPYTLSGGDSFYLGAAENRFMIGEELL